ncbi:hypothetical protein GCM10010912_36020 [Paenibacillus albidus]|uniref:Uncharacterized protein n=1 Tax=Paenibacillus albidus TaxID=2041023 RepID=A0A917CHB6_9BACL|nr:hypothetical protein [Paenibacillus albidus]GGF87522.1 hypothetical protein GCM10010912_36020 [Paenibacillus albidus]
MKIAVYVVDYKGDWSLWISLALAVDTLWWQGTDEGGDYASPGWNRKPAEQVVILSPSLPLGWAIKLREGFLANSGMRTWGSKEWGVYIDHHLEQEIREERAAGGNWPEGWAAQGIRIWRSGDKNWGGLGTALENDGRAFHNAAWLASPGAEAQADLCGLADQLMLAVAGRSLLTPEVEALLLERCPLLGDDWRRAAQLAHLQGRLNLAAAVGERAAGRFAPQHRGRQLPAVAGLWARAAAAWLPPSWRAASRGAVPQRAACAAAASPPAARPAPRAALWAAPIARPASLSGAAGLARCCCAVQRFRPCGPRPVLAPPWRHAGGA